MVRVEAEGGKGPNLSHPHSCFVSLIPKANIHKSGLSFLIYQRPGAALSTLHTCRWTPPVTSWSRSSYSVRFVDVDTEFKEVMTLSRSQDRKVPPRAEAVPTVLTTL